VKQVYNFVAPGSQAKCDFALVINLSFYRFGIPSCQATNHKQILKDTTQHDVIVHFGCPLVPDSKSGQKSLQWKIFKTLKEW